jgi:hypothetical protein
MERGIRSRAAESADMLSPQSPAFIRHLWLACQCPSTAKECPNAAENVNSGLRALLRRGWKQSSARSRQLRRAVQESSHGV